MIQRPPFTIDLSKSLLGAQHFQIAYATNDLDRARAIFADRYDIHHFTQLKGALPSGGHIHVELAWIGGIMIELLTASGEGSAIYMDRLPIDAGFVLQHHHMGYLIYGDAAWDNLMANANTNHHAMPHISLNAGFMKSCFVDAPELGHYLEYICPEPAGITFFQSVAQNG